MNHKINLTKGFIALVDEEDYERASAFKWHVNETKNGLRYARRTIVFPRVKGKQPQVKQYLHRFILNNFDPLIKIDFKDDNPLNCQKENLIISNHACISHNTVPRKRIISKGVRKKFNKWHARIFDGTKSVFIGSYSTEDEAAAAYSEKNKEIQIERGAQF